MTRRVPVLLPYPFPGPFDYRVPPGLSFAPGDVVAVPLNGRAATGVVWDGPGDGAVPEARLKPVAARLDVPPMTAGLRRFVDWVAGYTLSPPGEVMAMAFRAAALEPPVTRTGWIAAPDIDARLTTARERVLAVLADGLAWSTADLARAAAVTPGVVRAMAQAGLLRPAALPEGPRFGLPEAAAPGPVLSADQDSAAEALRASVAARTFGVSLLEGVTGSGKTAVYLEAAATCLDAGRQVLILLPEIALSTQVLDRVRERFGAAPAVWHSDLTGAMRRATWRAVAEGAAPLVVGARSALFLPFPALGLIVVDEEHETAFKQEDGVIYNARDMAVVRARFSGAHCVLASATPSLESIFNAEAGRYAHHVLPRRANAAQLPRVAAIDLRATPAERGSFLAPPLVAAIGQALAQGEQALLFLNRRGFAPLTLCRTCGHRFHCPNCSAWLVEHRARRTLQCHHCGHAIAVPDACPACGDTNSLTPVGPGVERITAEAARRFPGARLLAMSSDTIQRPSQAEAAARAIRDREVDLVIGTQIVAKGWHFPHLTVVGVVDADLGLAGADLRAAERTVQVLHQVAGRAGRGALAGQALLQTWDPEHPVMQALVAGDLPGFRAAEAAQRAPGHWPPYGRLAALIVSSADPVAADRTAAALGRAAPHGDGVWTLGPAPAPLALLRGRHRRRLLLRTRRDIAVQPILRAWLATVPVPRPVRVDVDVDPVSFL